MSKVQNESLWMNLKMSARLFPSPGSRGNSTSLPSLASGGYLHSLAGGRVAPFFHLQSLQGCLGGWSLSHRVPP